MSHDHEIEVSVVMPTRNRRQRLEGALASLRAQTLAAERFEVIVVDDASTDGTVDALAAEQARGALRLRVVARDRPSGPGGARNDGWRGARAPLVAFMDDDCVADPGWLEAGVVAWGGDPNRFVQGPTTPLLDEWDEMSPWSYTVDIPRMSTDFPTCNMFYPRVLLERLGGFDVHAFPHMGEDTDLAWRAKRAGGKPAFAPEAGMRHAVVRVGVRGFLSRVLSMSDAMALCVRHPEFRRQRLHLRFFWNWQHWLLLRLWVALALPWRRTFWPLKLWLGRSYIVYRLPHPRDQHPSLVALLSFALSDTFAVAGVLRGAIRFRTPVM